MQMRTIILAAALMLALPALAAAQAQTPATPEAVQKRHEELTAQQALQRLQQAEKNLGEAIGHLQASPPADAAQPQTGGAMQPAAVAQAEQALHDVRRAIDEIEIRQEQRQRVLDRLDDADSAMRMARQPEAGREHKRLADALRGVQREVRGAQESMPESKAKER